MKNATKETRGIGEKGMGTLLFVLVLTVSFMLTACSDYVNPASKNNDNSQTTTSVSSELNADEIRSVSYYCASWSVDKETVKRFCEIVENATPISPKDVTDTPQGSFSCDFNIFPNAENAIERNFTINNELLTEKLADGTCQYYLLDKDRQDYKFVLNSCGK